MPGSRLVPLLGLACGFALSVAADAKTLQSTKYAYYTVSGDTAAELYSAMLRRGPHVNGAKAYAATTATSSQDGRLLQAKSCVVQDYRLKIDFIIRLPQLKTESVLPKADRSRWRQFSQFLKRHEETHRSIWLGCAQELEAKVRAIKATTCDDADSKASKLWDAMRKSCSRKHDAFDAAEQKRLLQHPFVRQVFRAKNRATHAAAAQ
jgi:predicted secreted Zn-dependent protease